MTSRDGQWGLLARIGPGLLLAATGVGAGDLANAAIVGQRYGLALLWTIAVGAALKFGLNEGLARFQLASGKTLLEGAIQRYGRWFGWLFLGYLLYWSFFVSRALLLACSQAALALVPALREAPLLGIAAVHGLMALLIALRGSFRLFERAMMVLVAAMVAIVVTTAVVVAPSLDGVIAGLVPGVPAGHGEAAWDWALAVLGGVGGTVTILCYGYWLREEGMKGPQRVAAMRVDLGIGYLVTGAFGLAMMIIGQSVAAEGRQLGLLVGLAEGLEARAGAFLAALFLVGVWCTVLTSLLGVIQAVPLLFADLWRETIARRPDREVPLRSTAAYRIYAVALTFLPLLGLSTPFEEAQKVYGMVGALIMPLVALLLLDLAGPRGPLRDNGLRNGWFATIVFLAALVGFAAMIARGILPS